MIALYRSDRQADALQAYQDARRKLVEDLGIEPGESLRALERAILAQDPKLHLPVAQDPVAAEPAVETQRGPFVGRDSELAELVAGLDDAFAGRGRLFLLVGEPGIGKSRLAEELIAVARARAARVLVGRCWEAGGAPAYWPWVQSLRSYIDDVAPEALRLQLGAGAADIAEMIPQLRALFPDLPPVPALESEGARFRLFDATARFLRSAATAQPLVVVLEDLHAADTPSLLLLQFVARELGGSRLLVVATHRHPDSGVPDPLADAVAELRREHAVRLVQLGGLAKDDHARFVEVVAGFEPPERATAAIYRATEGNPLFAAEVVRLLVAENRFDEVGRGDAGTPPVPQEVRRVIERRLERLSPECRHTLTLASVIGREFDLETLGRLAETSSDDLLEVLDEAIAARAVGEVGGTLGRLAFSHALVRDTLYDELDAGPRRRLHRQLGGVLESLYAADPDTHLAELAHHFFRATDRRDADKAIEYARRAAERAVGMLAFEEAVRLLEMALTALAYRQPPDEQRRCELLIAAGEAMARAGDAAAAKKTFLEAAELAERVGLADHLARAALGYAGRFVFTRAGADSRAAPLLESALSALGSTDSALRAKALARLAGLLRDRSSQEPRLSYSREAVEIGRRLGDSGTLAYALNGLHAANWAPDTAEQRLAIAMELTQLAEAAGEKERALEGQWAQVLALLELGRAAPARAAHEIQSRQAAELKQPSQLWVTTMLQAMLELFGGRFDQAEELASQAYEIGRRAHPEEALMSYRLQTFELARVRGALDPLEPTVQQTVVEYPWYPVWRVLLALLHAEIGRPDEARSELAGLAVDRFEALPFDNNWLFALAMFTDCCQLVGDARWAGTLYELIEPYERSNAVGAEVCTGSVARTLGILASLASRWQVAARHFEAALEMNARMRARPWLAQTRLDYARMLAARGASGDRERAIELTDSATRAFAELGMEGSLRRGSSFRESMALLRRR
jgi:predicted ATPase